MSAVATPDTDGSDAVLRAALQAAHGAGAHLESWTADPGFTAHGRGRITLYDVRARVAGAAALVRHRWLGKSYDRDADARRVAAVLERLAASDCRARGGPEVSRVVAYDPAQRLLFLTYEAGEPVSAAIGRDPETVLGVVGRALAALHATAVTPTGTRPPPVLLDDLRPRIPQLCVRFPAEATAFRETARRLERAVPSLPARPSFLHGDFGPTNLLWRDGGIVALDFDKCAHGDPALDLGNLLAQLRRMSVRSPAELADFPGARGHVLAAYRGGAPDPDLERRLAWYERVIVLRKIHRLACNSARHPDAERNPQRQAEARRLLSGALSLLTVYD